MRLDRALRRHNASHPAVRNQQTRSLGRPGDFQCKVLRAFELRPEYRDVFLLKEIQGYTITEIAAILGISIRTALSRWNSARREIGTQEAGALEVTQ